MPSKPVRVAVCTKPGPSNAKISHSCTGNEDARSTPRKFGQLAGGSRTSARNNMYVGRDPCPCISSREKITGPLGERSKLPAIYPCLRRQRPITPVETQDAAAVLIRGSRDQHEGALRYTASRPNRGEVLYTRLRRLPPAMSKEHTRAGRQISRRKRVRRHRECG